MKCYVCLETDDNDQWQVKCAFWYKIKAKEWVEAGRWRKFEEIEIE